MNATPKSPRKDTAGFRERPLETFEDVKKALSAYLRRTDPEFRKRSDHSQARSIESHQRKLRERAGIHQTQTPT